MLKSSSFKSLLLLLSLLNFYFQFTYSLGRCWEQAFVNNTVFINTISTGDVQMGYLSQLNKLNYPNIIPSGMPKITVELLKEKCDKLGIKMCAAIQFFQCPGTWGEDKLSYDWGNLLTPEEYKASRRKGAVLPIGEEVTSGIAYKRIRCLSKSARNGVPNHTNYIPDLITPMFSYFGFSSTLLNYVNSYFHSTTTKNNKYLTEAEQEEEDLFFDLLDEDRT